MPPQKNLLLGAHVSIAGGLKNSITEGEKLGCSAIQIFTRNNRQWSFSPLSDEEAQAFIEAQQKSEVKVVISHASYLINIGSPKKTVLDSSIRALIAELIRCHQAKIPYVVLHPGSCLGLAEQDCEDQIADLLTQVLKETPDDVSIVLENMAGQGSAIGCSIEQLAAIREKTRPQSRIGFCFDTCHGFAAGYDLRTEKKYHEFWDKFEAILGIKNLRVMHLNDSKKPCCSHVDRHEDIGKGEIGLELFRVIMQDKRFEKIPKIIETPMETLDDHRRNLTILRKLAE